MAKIFLVVILVNAIWHQCDQIIRFFTAFGSR